MSPLQIETIRHALSLYSSPTGTIHRIHKIARQLFDKRLATCLTFIAVLTSTLVIKALSSIRLSDASPLQLVVRTALILCFTINAITALVFFFQENQRFSHSLNSASVFLWKPIFQLPPPQPQPTLSPVLTALLNEIALHRMLLTPHLPTQTKKIKNLLKERKIPDGVDTLILSYIAPPSLTVQGIQQRVRQLNPAFKTLLLEKTRGNPHPV